MQVPLMKKTRSPSSGHKVTSTTRQLDCICNLRVTTIPMRGDSLSEDPIGLAGGDANFFRYVDNNPVNATDPSGQYLFVPGKHLAKEIAETLTKKTGARFIATNFSCGKGGLGVYMVMLHPKDRGILNEWLKTEKQKLDRIPEGDKDKDYAKSKSFWYHSAAHASDYRQFTEAHTTYDRKTKTRRLWRRKMDLDIIDPEKCARSEIDALFSAGVFTAEDIARAIQNPRPSTIDFSPPIVVDIANEQARRRRERSGRQIPEGLLLSPKEEEALLTSLIQIGIDIAGIFDPSPICDGTSAMLSIYQRDWLGVGLSVAGMFPYFGDSLKLAKLKKWVDTFIKGIRYGKTNAKFAEFLRPIAKKLWDELEKHKEKCKYLPKWAQDEIDRLKKVLDEFLHGKPKKKPDPPPKTKPEPPPKTEPEPPPKTEPEPPPKTESPSDADAPNKPKPGRMHVEEGELLDGTKYRDYEVPGRSEQELFSARQFVGSDTLQVSWTATLSSLLNKSSFLQINPRVRTRVCE